MTLTTSTLAQSDIILVILPVASFAVAVIVGIAGVWVAYLAGFPRQRLLYWIPAAVPLVNAPRGPGHGFQLLYNGAEVAQPHLLSVQLISRGRDDISIDFFEDGEPISLDLGVPIIDVLQIDPIGRRAFSPTASPDKNTLKIGPSLIGKRQMIIITLLLDGSPAHPAHLNALLKNVNVRKCRKLPTFFNRNSLVGIAATMVVASVAFIVLAVLAANRIYMPQTTPSFESNIKTLTEVVNGLLSHSAEQIYIALASIAGLLAVLARVAALGTRPE
jgi:hypothetical protein